VELLRDLNLEANDEDLRRSDSGECEKVRSDHLWVPLEFIPEPDVESRLVEDDASHFRGDVEADGGFRLVRLHVACAPDREHEVVTQVDSLRFDKIVRGCLDVSGTDQICILGRPGVGGESEVERKRPLQDPPIGRRLEEPRQQPFEHHSLT
jgi:hypothetical protein